jgi:hypothetical protein
MKKLLLSALTLAVLSIVLPAPAWSAIHNRVMPDPQAGPKQHQHHLHHKDPYAPRKPPHPHKMPKPPIKKHHLHIHKK